MADRNPFEPSPPSTKSAVTLVPNVSAVPVSSAIWQMPIYPAKLPSTAPVTAVPGTTASVTPPMVPIPTAPVTAVYRDPFKQGMVLSLTVDLLREQLFTIYWNRGHYAKKIQKPWLFDLHDGNYAMAHARLYQEAARLGIPDNHTTFFLSTDFPYTAKETYEVYRDNLYALHLLCYTYLGEYPTFVGYTLVVCQYVAESDYFSVTFYSPLEDFWHVRHMNYDEYNVFVKKWSLHGRVATSFCDVIDYPDLPYELFIDV